MFGILGLLGIGVGASVSAAKQASANEEMKNIWREAGKEKCYGNTYMDVKGVTRDLTTNRRMEICFEDREKILRDEHGNFVKNLSEEERQLAFEKMRRTNTDPDITVFDGLKRLKNYFDSKHLYAQPYKDLTTGRILYRVHMPYPSFERPGDTFQVKMSRTRDNYRQNGEARYNAVLTMNKELRNKIEENIENKQKIYKLMLEEEHEVILPYYYCYYIDAETQMFVRKADGEKKKLIKELRNGSGLRAMRGYSVPTPEQEQEELDWLNEGQRIRKRLLQEDLKYDDLDGTTIYYQMMFGRLLS